MCSIWEKFKMKKLKIKWQPNNSIYENVKVFDLRIESKWQETIDSQICLFFIYVNQKKKGGEMLLIVIHVIYYLD